MSKVDNAFLLLVAAVLIAPSPAPGAEETRIGRIRILRKEVFNPSVPGFDRFPYTWVNALHVRTRENVIREALLFHEGDPYDPDLLEEAERNLRHLPFVAFASVVPAERTGNEQDVVVETHDMWSTQLSVDAGNRNGAAGEEGNRIGMTLEEENLFGYGKKIELAYTRSDGKQGFGWLVDDPQLFGSRWTFRVFDKTRRPGRDRGIEIERPLYSLGSRWSLRGAILRDSGEDRVFADDEEVGRLFREFRSESIQAGRMFGPRQRKLLLRLLFAEEERRYSDFVPAEAAFTDTTVADSKRSTRFLGFSLALGTFRFAKEEEIDFFDRIEDVELGGYLGILAGPLVGEGGRSRVSSEGELALRVSEHGYLSWLGLASLDRTATGWGRGTAGLAVGFHRRVGGRGALATRALWEGLWRPDPGEELFADEPNGLRGYSDRSDAGIRRFLLNLEGRYDTGIRILTVAVGTAAFFDTGAAWDEKEAVRIGGLRSAIGAGLRLGLTKTRDGNTFRLDLARSLADGENRFNLALGHLFLMAHPFSDFRRPAGP